jgi:hypothetical protein
MEAYVLILYLMLLAMISSLHRPANLPQEPDHKPYTHFDLVKFSRGEIYLGHYGDGGGVHFGHPENRIVALEINKETGEKTITEVDITGLVSRRIEKPSADGVTDEECLDFLGCE